uniref:DEAD/DEAH box helicase n=1 Tax=Ningiella ruwaisensis TaxID=2364274 RepID=UPI00109F79D0|nr:DEAD/DEAH box helicase [Ningiella ruwaisensis]
MESFKDYNFSDEINSALDALKYHEPTKTQQACLHALLEGKDVAVEAQTGSGKTLAFGLTILQKLLDSQAHSQNEQAADSSHPHALVLCPTRELAEQVTYQLQLLARRIANTKILAVFGGVAIAPQLSSLKHPPAVIVGTPGRLMDIAMQGRLSFKGLKTLVLDEADRMLDMGFEDQVDWLLKAINDQAQGVQTLLFSATFGGNIQSLSAQYQKDAQTIQVDDGRTHQHIEQTAYKVLANRRAYAVAALLSEHQPESAIVFCQRKQEVVELHQQLQEDGFGVVQLQGDMEQFERSNAVLLFSADCANVLVATDVAARGLDIPSVDLVINYSISDDLDTHTHRVGRTGRAGLKGKAITLIDDTDETKLIGFNAQLPSDIPVKSGLALRFHKNRIREPQYVGVQIDAGKKQKISKGDILGALAKNAHVPAKDIGKIHVSSHRSFAAIKIRSVKRTLLMFRESKVKGKRLRAKKLV